MDSGLLDCEFVNLVDQITANIRCLNLYPDAQLVERWVTRLHEESDKLLRNDYCKNLNLCILSGCLTYPFNEIPPSGRLPLYKDIVNPRLNPLAPPLKLNFSPERKVKEWLDPNQGLFDEYFNDDGYNPATFNDQGPCPPCPALCEPEDECLDYKKTQEISKITVCDVKENNEQVDRLIAAICPTTLLEEFASQIARFTCDNGKILFEIISEETNNFRDYVRSLYESRNKDISNTLNEEQKRVKDNFEQLEGRLLARIRTEMSELLSAIPDFRWEEYAADKKKYIWNKIYPSINKEMSKCLKPSEMRAGFQRKTWLNEVARQIQEDNANRRAELTKLSKLLTSLSTSYACSQNSHSEHIALMECEADILKNRLIENQRIIEQLLTKIEILRQNQT